MSPVVRPASLNPCTNVTTLFRLLNNDLINIKKYLKKIKIYIWAILLGNIEWSNDLYIVGILSGVQVKIRPRVSSRSERDGHEKRDN